MLERFFSRLDIDPNLLDSLRCSLAPTLSDDLCRLEWEWSNEVWLEVASSIDVYGSCSYGVEAGSGSGSEAK